MTGFTGYVYLLSLLSRFRSLTVQKPGGQGVMNDPSLGPVLYYHYVDTRIGYADGQKQFGVNKLNFSSGWPVV
jgi:arabinan endo-1,5-alpha-L-arabinosidase